MIDPANALLGLKNVAFGLLFLLCLLYYKKEVWKPAFSIIAVVYAIITLSIGMGYAQDFSFDTEMTLAIYKTFVLLLLLLWINKISFLERLLFPSLCIAFTTIIIYFIMDFCPVLANRIYAFFGERILGIIMISRRNFIGVDVSSIYYTSVAIMIIPLALFLYRALFAVEQRKRNYLYAAIFFITLLFAGTRACMLSAILLTGTMIIIRLYKSRIGKIIGIIAIGVVVLFTVKTVYQMMTQKDEISLKIKMGHVESYKELITTHPFILVLGQGAGSTFYSVGVKEYLAQTEWSYAEIIRWFGLLGGGIILSIYLVPLYILYQKRKILPYALPMQIGYVFYLFIAGTNPLLLGSNGLLVLLVMYNYALNPNYEQYV
jgi:hypothetical protein